MSSLCAWLPNSSLLRWSDFPETNPRYIGFGKSEMYWEKARHLITFFFVIFFITLDWSKQVFTSDINLLRAHCGVNLHHRFLWKVIFPKCNRTQSIFPFFHYFLIGFYTIAVKFFISFFYSKKNWNWSIRALEVNNNRKFAAVCSWCPSPDTCARRVKILTAISAYGISAHMVGLDREAVARTINIPLPLRF